MYIYICGDIFVWFWVFLFGFLIPKTSLKLVSDQHLGIEKWHLSSLVHLVCGGYWVQVLCAARIGLELLALLWLAGWGLRRFCNLWKYTKRRKTKWKAIPREIPSYTSGSMFVKLLNLLILSNYFLMWHLYNFLTPLACALNVYPSCYVQGV